MKTLSNAELQDAIRYSTDCVKTSVPRRDAHQLHLEHLVALLDEQRRRASERAELTLEPMTTTLERASFEARVDAQDGPEWVEWHGGECPVPQGHEVQCKFGNGNTGTRQKAGFISWVHYPSAPSTDVTAYRDWTAWEQSK